MEEDNEKTWVCQVGEFTEKLIPHIKKEREWSFISRIDLDGKMDLDREISFEAWGVDKSVRARKVMKTARPKAVIASHHIDTSRVVTNAQGKTKRI